MQSCTRESSLDSDIVESSIVPNDFPGFLVGHRAIRTICFNGAKAEHSFRRYVLAGLPEAREIEYHRLPSTSPANASISYLRKRQAWQVVRRRAAARPYR
jgi:TDG/mug DNA glycosylase family protein